MDSILVLGLVKFTLQIFFLKRVGDAHPKEKKKGEKKKTSEMVISDNHLLPRAQNEEQNNVTVR